MATFTTLTGNKGYADGAGVDTHIIGADAVKVSISGNMNGDNLNIEGLAADYQIRAKGRTITLTDGAQTIVFKLANNGTADLRFLDGNLEVSFNGKNAFVGGQKLTSKLKDFSDKNLEALGSSTSAGMFEVIDTTPAATTLTINDDALRGTTGSDAFKGRIGTVDGAEGNTLNSGDSIDGLGGNDSLTAQVFAGTSVVTGSWIRPIQPEIMNVEVVKLEAQYRDIASGLSTYQLSTGEDSLDDVYIRASEMTDIKELWSNKSTADLIVQDLTTNKSNGTVGNTNEMTIGMAYTGNSDSRWDQSDYKVYFDQDYLVPSEFDQGSELYIELMDMDSALTGGLPLEDNPFGKITFKMDGVLKTLTFGDGNSGVKTYAQLLAAIQTAITAAAVTDPAFATLTAAFDGKFTATDTDNLPGGSAQGDRIVITNSGPQQLTAGDMFATGSLPAGKDFHTGFTAKEPGTERIPVEINVALEKVGNSGDGGNLVIGSMNKDEWDSNTVPGTMLASGNGYGSGGYNDTETYNDTVAGFEQFNVTVYGNSAKPSSVASLRSTNNTLETVKVKSETRTDKSYADLIIGNQHATEATYGFGLKDVRTFDSTEFKADATITAILTDEMDEKYDGGTIDVNYDFGAGDDSLTLEVAENHGQGLRVDIAMGEGADEADISIDGDAVDAVTESFALDLGNGDNSAVVSVVDTTDNAITHPTSPTAFDLNGVSRETTDLLDNLSIKSGSGKDSVEIQGNGQFDIQVSGGSDFVYINSGGNKARGDLWNRTGDNDFPDTVVYKAKLAISVGGFESVVDIDTGSDFILTQAELNQHIIKAITQSDTIKQLVGYELGTANQNLILQALIDGVNEVGLQIRQPDLIAAGANPTTNTAEVNLPTGGTLSKLVSDIITTQSVAGVPIAPEVSSTTLLGGSNDGSGILALPAFTDTYPSGPLSGTAANHFFGNLKASDGFAGTIVTQLAGAEGGSIGTVYNDSVINMGTGAKDLVVLSAFNSDLGHSVNTLVFDEAWDKVEIVNFFDKTTTANLLTGGVGGQVNGGHLIDVTAFLTNEWTPSGSVESTTYKGIVVQDNQATDLTSGTVTMSANSFHFMTVDQLEKLAGGTTNYSLSSLSASDLDTLIEGFTNGITYAAESVSLTPGSTDLGKLAFGTTLRTSIIAVQNVDLEGAATADNVGDSSNYGEYVLFQVTYGTTAEAADSVVSVKKLGYWDFGDSLGLGTSGEAFQANLVGGADLPPPEL